MKRESTAAQCQREQSEKHFWLTIIITKAIHVLKKEQIINHKKPPSKEPNTILIHIKTELQCSLQQKSSFKSHYPSSKAANLNNLDD